jgi:hypothetical protein
VMAHAPHKAPVALHTNPPVSRRAPPRRHPLFPRSALSHLLRSSSALHLPLYSSVSLHNTLDQSTMLHLYGLRARLYGP